MKKILFALIVLAGLASCSGGDNDPRLVIITFDGLRWQEVFTGVDSFLVGNPDYVRNPEELKAKYWRDTPEERRQVLMPFIWSYGAENGFLVGNRNKGSQMQVANTKNYSYPGYSEMFCGWADDERVNSNNPVPNPNKSVLEVANADPRYKDKVMLYASWESIRYAVNNERGGFPGSVAYEPNVTRNQSPVLQLLDEMQEGMFHYWGSERFDSYTYAYALETLKKDHPKVLYVGFGDTDEWAHAGKYDEYVRAANYTDNFIRRIVETCESDPFYKGKTTYMLTCDHGRGYRGNFTGHGAGTRGSENTWFITFGKGIEKLGETSNNGPYYTQQFAATIAKVLGLDFTPDNGVKQEPIDPNYKGEPLVEFVPQTDFGKISAVKDAKPKGKGVSFTYHEGQVKSVDELKDLPVLDNGTMPNFSFNRAKVDEYFGFQYKTLLKISQAGKYTFYLTTDDGGKMWIDGKLVINNDGSHGSNTEEAFMDLEAGYHRIEVKYFQKTQGKTLELAWQGPGFGEQVVPDDVLFAE